MFFYTAIMNYQKEKAKKKKIPFKISSRRMKYIRINLTKKVEDQYSENYKTMIKKIEDDTNK